MKNLFAFIILLSIACSNTQAQKISFTDSTNKWNVRFSHIGGTSSGGTRSNSIYQYSPDTAMVDTVVYKKLVLSTITTLIRTDTAGKKVYTRGYLTNNVIDTVEYLLYDFSLQIGDSFKSSTHIHKLSRVDSTQINNIWHNVYYMIAWDTNMPSHPDNYAVIEGIGCTDGILHPKRPIRFEGKSELVCFYNSTGQPKVSPKVENYAYPQFDNDTSCLLSVNNLDAASNAIKIYPQPASSFVNIDLHEKMDGSIVLYNMNGQVVAKQEISNTKHVVFTPQVAVAGIYFYKIYNNKSSQLHTGTISFY